MYIMLAVLITLSIAVLKSIHNVKVAVKQLDSIKKQIKNMK